jgi:ribonuclease VapC
VSVLLDAFALIALLIDEPAAEEVEAILRRGEAAMPAINLAEALDVLQRLHGVSRERLDKIIAPLLSGSIALLPVDEQMARDAAGIRARRYHRTRAPISLADCVLLAAAKSSDALATADAPLIAVAGHEGVRVKALTRRVVA